MVGVYQWLLALMCPETAVVVAGGGGGEQQWATAFLPWHYGSISLATV